MPVQTIEELVELLEKTSNPLELGRHIDAVKAGMRNLLDRFKVVEQSRVDDLYRMQHLEALTKEEKATLDSIATDRTALQQAVARLEARLAALETKSSPPAGTPSATPFAKAPIPA